MKIDPVNVKIDPVKSLKVACSKITIPDFSKSFFCLAYLTNMFTVPMKTLGEIGILIINSFHSHNYISLFTTEFWETLKEKY